MTTATTTVTSQKVRYLGLTLFAIALAAVAALLVILPDVVIVDGITVQDEWLRYAAAALASLAVAVLTSIRNPGGPAAMSITAVVFAALSVGALVWSRADGNDTIEFWFFIVYIVVMAIIAGLVALGAKTEMVAAVSAAEAESIAAENLGNLTES